MPSELQIKRSYRAAFIQFESTWKRIESIRRMLPADMRSKSPVLDELYKVCDKAVVYMMNHNRKLWPRN